MLPAADVLGGFFSHAEAEDLPGRNPGRPGQGHINRARLGFKLAPKQVAAEFSSTAAIKEAAKQGLGLAIISHLAVLDELKNGTLAEIGVQKEKMERYFYLVHHKNRTLPGPYRKFCEFLKQSNPVW
jgi:DNA-binding transcriptional LysR family regulator